MWFISHQTNNSDSYEELPITPLKSACRRRLAVDMHKKLACFFAVFGTVYFLESIGGFYMTTAIVYIERQFQIPSRMSGTMVSAGDFAYIPLVIFTGYFGGKGNRAKWIGAGCMLIAIANLLISSSNFLFPVEEFHVEHKQIPNSLIYEAYMGSCNNLSTAEYWLDDVLDELDENSTVPALRLDSDSPFVRYSKLCFEQKDHPICKEVEERLGELRNVTVGDIAAVRSLTQLPYAFCNPVINTMRIDHKKEECESHTESYGPFAMIFGGLLILGVGRTMPFSLGLPLIDDNVKKTNLPVYFAIMFFMKILGPVIGLLVGSQLNKIYTTFKAPPGLNPHDPKWIGCWWLGFLLFGCVLFFPSLTLFLFPSDDIEDEMDGESEDTKNKVEKEKMLGEGPPVKPKRRLNLRDRHVRESDANKDVCGQFEEFLGVVKNLFQNKIFVGALLGRVVDVLAFKGFFVYLSKYIELQFGVPQYRIQKYLAGTGVIGFAAGVLVGSLVMKKFKFEGRRAAAWVAMSSCLAAFLSFTNGVVGCQSPMGLMGEQAIATNMSFPSCRTDCMCHGMPFHPVCNSRGEVFYSPCHAGCPLSSIFLDQQHNYTSFSDTDNYIVQHVSNNQTFYGCECSGTKDMEISRDLCHTDHCESQFKTFFIVQSIGSMVGGLAVVPGMLIILRAVPPEHRSLSLGINGFLVSLFATLPSPVLWGKIIDMSCLLWGTVCNRTGACEIYDTTRLRISMHLIYGGMRVFSLLSDIWVFYWAKGLKILQEEDEQEDKESEEKTDNGIEQNGKEVSLSVAKDGQLPSN